MNATPTSPTKQTIPTSPIRLLLVDDVMTTGATAHEASLAALNAGAREVRVFCVARAM